ncbi:hypothetical protein DITRI_Ditri05aG0032100 [Diplodiscus trichospermus]
MGKAGVAVATRNHDRSLIDGLIAEIKTDCVLGAEARAFKVGVDLALQKRFERVVFETDWAILHSELVSTGFWLRGERKARHQSTDLVGCILVCGSSVGAAGGSSIKGFIASGASTLYFASKLLCMVWVAMIVLILRASSGSANGAALMFMLKILDDSLLEWLGGFS